VALTHFCWHCYAQNERPDGLCARCGEEIAEPADTTFDDRLLWALRHPIPERRMVAVRALARRRAGRAREPLHELATRADDPYLAAAALEALVELDGIEPHRALVAGLARQGPAPVRRVASVLDTGRRSPT